MAGELGVNERLELLFAEINKKQKGSIYTLGDEEAWEMERVATNIADLDNVIGGGLPRGKVIELYGAPSSGKTSLALHIASRYQNVIYASVEGLIPQERITMYGISPEHFHFLRSDRGESIFNRFIQFARAGADLLVIDSIPFLQSQEVLDKIEKAVNKNSVEELRVGSLARMLSKYLPYLVSTIELSGTTVLLVNQVRSVMNAMPFAEQTTTPGGWALEHAVSLKIQLARKAWIETTNYNPAISADKVPVGIEIKARIRKSKVSNPNGECIIPYFFTRGFVKPEDVDKIRDEIREKMKNEQYLD